MLLKKGISVNMNIKSEKGVTLTSLIIYVIAMLITISIITVVTGYFKKNVSTEMESYTFYSEFTRFQSYFIDEVNRKDNKILEVVNGEGNNQTYIAFSSGNQYTYIPSNHAIYQNTVKIASGVQNCKFHESVVNGKQAVKVDISIKGNSETNSQMRSTQFILEN